MSNQVGGESGGLRVFAMVSSSADYGGVNLAGIVG